VLTPDNLGSNDILRLCKRGNHGWESAGFTLIEIRKC
jgi:hypothetical protein